MDYSNIPQTPRRVRRPNRFSHQALALGFLSVATSLYFFISIPLACVDIIFALLSRQGNGPLERRAKLAIFIAIVALVITITFSVYAVYTTIQQYGGWDAFYQYYTDYVNEVMDAYSSTL